MSNYFVVQNFSGHLNHANFQVQCLTFVEVSNLVSVCNAFTVICWNFFLSESTRVKKKQDTAFSFLTIDLDYYPFVRLAWTCICSLLVMNL